MRTLLLIGASFALMGSPTLAQQPAAGGQQATATFVDAQGKEVGRARLVQTPNGVLINVEVNGLPPGSHAFHVHETGRCDPGTSFNSAGGHFANGGRKHGYLTEGGPHAGDMPNQFVGQDGVLRAEVLNPNITLGSGQGSVFDNDGSALVIHAGADDYSSQPAGDAGGRLACGVIRQQG